MTHAHDLLKHIGSALLQRLTRNMDGADGEDRRFRPSSLSPYERGFWLNLLFNFAALAVVVLLCAWIGEIHILCFVSALVLLRLLYQFLKYKGIFEDNERIVNPIFEAVVLGTVVAFAKLLGDVSVHFAAAAQHSLCNTQAFIDTFHAIPGKKEGAIVAVFLVAAGIVIGFKPHNKAIASLEAFVKSCGIFDFLCNAYILAAGMWGSVAIHSALEVFHFSTTDLPWRDDNITTDSFWNASHQEAFCLLYNIQGSHLFYVLISAIPLAFVASTIWS